MQIIIFDVKTSNVLLDEACITAKITDVGLAKMIAGSEIKTLLVSFPPSQQLHYSSREYFLQRMSCAGADQL